MCVLGVGGIHAKNLGLLGKWKWRFLTEKDALWRRVINDFYGSDGGFDSLPGSRYRHRTWYEILKAVDNIKNIDPSFEGSFSLKISNGSNTMFWKDPWIYGGSRLKDLYPRCPPRGRAIDDVSSLVSLISSISISGEGADNWVWSREASGIFKVNTLSVHLQELLLADHSLGSHHIWNSWIPRKVNICVWRASINRLPTSIKENDQQKLLSILPFVKGNLLVRYLGVPLISKRIGIKECVSLIEKVKAKVNHWRNRFLTYAGKLQLIASVLESILSYWCCMFLLPKTVINDINSIMKIYLWSQSHDSKGKAKVAWKNVSTVKLKGVSIWVVQKEECDSWGWKNLLTIRDLIINHVLYKIGNGENTFMWYDNWSGLRPLINNISHIILYNARLQKESNVADMIADGSWINGSKWVNSVALSIILVPMIKQDLSGFVSNILESSGCDCTLLVVFSVLLGLGRELDRIDERERSNSG
ncbi:hypothetical protein Tco_0983955 [Tanacetum coccineum]